MAESFILQDVSEVLVLELGLILHASFVTFLPISWTVFAVALSVLDEHVRYVESTSGS